MLNRSKTNHPRSLAQGRLIWKARLILGLNQRVEMLSKGMEAFVASIEEQSGPMDPVTKARQLANDAEALVASTLGVRDAPGLEDVLPTMTMPCLLFAGRTSDPLTRSNRPLLSVAIRCKRLLSTFHS